MATSDKPNPNRRPKPASAIKGASDVPTPVSAWKSKNVGGTLITVPSGNTAMIRTPGIQVFLKQGVIPNALLPIIQDAMTRGGQPSEADLSKMIESPERLNQIIDLADAVTVYCCIDPVVAPVPTDEKGAEIPMDDPRRDENTLYVDEVDFNDKMFIFNMAVGGTADLEAFRS